jgi:hypothetical protein
MFLDQSGKFLFSPLLGKNMSGFPEAKLTRNAQEILS